jgi:hypothetical protein
MAAGVRVQNPPRSSGTGSLSGSLAGWLAVCRTPTTTQLRRRHALRMSGQVTVLTRAGTTTDVSVGMLRAVVGDGRAGAALLMMLLPPTLLLRRSARLPRARLRWRRGGCLDHAPRCRWQGSLRQPMTSALVGLECFFALSLTRWPRCAGRLLCVWTSVLAAPARSWSVSAQRSAPLTSSSTGRFIRVLLLLCRVGGLSWPCLLRLFGREPRRHPRHINFPFWAQAAL